MGRSLRRDRVLSQEVPQVAGAVVCGANVAFQFGLFGFEGMGYAGFGLETVEIRDGFQLIEPVVPTSDLEA